MTYSFFVPGIPKPAGSKRAFAFRRANGKLGVTVTDASGQPGKDWRGDVKVFAREVCKEPLKGPLQLIVTFYMPRPKSHYGTGKKRDVLRLDAPSFHTSKPDATKLVRAIEDAMTGIAWEDDAQVVSQVVGKVYAELGRVGANVVVRRMEVGNA